MKNILPPLKRLAPLENFGHSLQSISYVYRPREAEEISELIRLARSTGLTIGLRGAGRSYNDAAINSGEIILDLRRMNRILDWDPQNGIINMEPGVTLQQLWQHVLPDGWWPPVVSGTMSTTLGGCLGMNIHGKNNFQSGTIGEHVLAFSALLPTNSLVTCTPKRNGDLFRAMIGGLGMLGVFTSITLKMKRVYSGLLDVHAWNVPDLQSHLSSILDNAGEHDYVVGWLDTTARRKHIGRGQLHAADNLPDGADPDPQRTQCVDYQTLPSRFFGVVPKSILHYFMSPFMNSPGAWGVNTAKYLLGRRKTYQQTHAAFHFLLDYVPDWELAYGRKGLVQYQCFLPVQAAQEVFHSLLTLSHDRGLPSFLGVTKRHRPDPFLLTHSLDGYSLALDFKVTDGNRLRLAGMMQEFDHIVLDAGGRFYFAKNSETSAESALRFLGGKTVKRFRELKKRCDPDNILQTDLFRRIFIKI